MFVHERQDVGRASFIKIASKSDQGRASKPAGISM